jgi:hypothetical protein
MNSALAWALWTAVSLSGAPNDPKDPAEPEASAVPRRHESVVIVASLVDPRLDRRNRAVFEQTLFSRDDQLLDTLAAGINAGQHEGGGKSLEVRRFGFNLDHGGVGGGLKVLVDDVPQNQATQGHGQGYLGGLKGVTPELIDEVDILNGPFSAEYGDFSGLGVVHIRMKESLADAYTARLQAGSFDSRRTLLAWSPRREGLDSFIAYEGSRTDGPFANPLRYRRHNLTGSLTRRLGEADAVGLRLSLAANDFTSSGQLPLDEVEAGRLDRFGFLDPDNGGRSRSGALAAYYRRGLAGGAALKLDAFVARSLFDLYSNFTFFLNDPEAGDEVQQHDSRLQAGLDGQYLRPHALGGAAGLLTAGFNVHENRILVGLAPSVGRRPVGITTRDHAHVGNAALYVQEQATLLGGRLGLSAGVRVDGFRFRVRDLVEGLERPSQSALLVQPKAGLTWAPWRGRSWKLHAHYGRGFSSQDARGITREPEGPKLATSDFVQLGSSVEAGRLSLVGDLFFVDRSHEQVYIPDDGSLELAGPSRAYGVEAKASLEIARGLSFSGGLTKVMNAFYRGTSPRVYVDSAPHLVANAALTFSGAAGTHASLRLRHTSDYRLDGSDPSVSARGARVLDLGVAQRLTRRVTLNLGLDNLTGARYFETQNLFESRLRPQDPAVTRIHATPGYPRTLTLGITVTGGDHR